LSQIDKLKAKGTKTLQTVKAKGKKTLQTVKAKGTKTLQTVKAKGTKTLQTVKSNTGKKYGCDDGWKYDGALTCSKIQKSNTICKPGKLKISQSCPSGQKLYLSGCYVNDTKSPLNRRGTATIVRKCEDYADVRFTTPAKKK
jgi:hypothetical protein